MAQRSRRARVEGARASQPKAEVVAPPAAVEEAPKLPNPVPGDDGEALARITASFAQRFPDEWEQWRLCPLAGGLEAMAEKLMGKG